MVGIVVFFAGYRAGAANSGLSTPNTIIHHVALKWKPDATDAQKQEAMTRLKALLARLPGVKNVWFKTVKIQPKEYSQTFVIEFKNQAALDAYTNHQRKAEWNEFYLSIRQESQNCQTTIESARGQPVSWPAGQPVGPGRLS
jgi:hypothetical protein